MNSAEHELLAKANASRVVGLYCMTTLVVEDARRQGQHAFSQLVESALDDLLEGLPRDEQRQALRLSYEMALGETSPAPPPLRLVFSRD